MELKPAYPYGKTLREFATSPVLWAQYWTFPNVLSTLRGTLGVILQICLMIVAADTWWPLINLAFWTATDFVDGYLAKYHGMASDLGKVIDTLADKLLIIVTLIVLAIQLLVQVVAGALWGDWWPHFALNAVLLAALAWVTSFTVVRDVRVTRMRLEQSLPTGKLESARQQGRVKMVVQSVVLVLFVAPLASLPITALVWVTVAKLLLLALMASFTWASWRDYKRDDEQKKVVQPATPTS